MSLVSRPGVVTTPDLLPRGLRVQSDIPYKSGLLTAHSNRLQPQISTRPGIQISGLVTKYGCINYQPLRARQLTRVPSVYVDKVSLN